MVWMWMGVLADVWRGLCLNRGWAESMTELGHSGTRGTTGSGRHVEMKGIFSEEC